MGWKTLVVTLLCPPYGIPLGFYGVRKDFKNWRIYVFCIALALGAFAYSFNPLGNPDLVNYFSHFETFGKKTFWEAVSYSGQTNQGLGKNLYTAYAFFWLIGKIGDYHLAPAVTTIVIYYIGYSITCKVAEDIKAPVDKVFKYLVFITVTINFYGIVNNIRNVFAFAVIGYAVFRDCYEKKRDLFTLILYAFPVFFHTSAILFIVLRLALIVPGRLKWLVTVALIGVRPVINLLHEKLSLVSSSNPFIVMVKFAIAKGYTFYNETTETSGEWGRIVAKSGSLRLSRYCYILLALFFMIVAFAVFKKKRKLEEKQGYTISIKHIEKVYYFSVFLSAITLSTFTMLTPEYWRFVSAFILYGGIIYLCCLESEKMRTVNSILLQTCFFVFSPICAALWIREFINGSELIIFLLKPFVSSPLVVFFVDALKIL